MKKQVFFFYFLVSTFQILAQDSLNTIKNFSKEQLFTDSVIPIPERPLLAAGEVFAVNMGVWAFDRYIIDGHYAYISMNSVRRNLKKGFYWDNDNFMTNLFNHPYHGSVYFNAARSNGMDFTRAGLFTFGGSLMWELFMECELPSTNDLIATSIGGMALGEMFFRLSDLALDNRLRGSSRFGSELVGFILSPGRGLTRLITGEMWKTSPYSGKQFAHTNLNFQIGMGIRALELFELESELLDEGLGACVDFQLEYGDLQEDENAIPYNYFTLRCGFNFQKNQPLIGNINLMACLYSKKIWTKNSQELFCGLFQHFDYYDSDTLTTDGTVTKTMTPFEVGTPASVGAGMIYQIKNPNKNWAFRANLHLNNILLGSSLSDHYRGNERKYNWGSGWALKYGMDFSWKNKLFVNYHINHNKIFTWKGYDPDMDVDEVDYSTLNVQGDKSQASYNIMFTQLGYRFKNNWEISYVRYDYFRETNYDYHPDVTSNASDERILITYKF